MNERIRELALQAREYATTRHPMSNIILSVNSDLFEEKFAELIVKECAEFVDYRLTNPDGASMAWCDGSDIKKHFGVEE